MTVGAAVLAAGASRRLGEPKQLALAGGVPLVRRAALAALACSCNEVAVVLGARASLVSAALDGLDVAHVFNAHWREGMAASIRAAVGWARQRAHDALLLVLADQPRLTARHLERIVRAHGRGEPLVASRYEGVLGVPALFASAEFGTLASLSGDVGARELLRSRRVAPVDFRGGAFDVDTPRDVAALSDLSLRAAALRTRRRRP